MEKFIDLDFDELAKKYNVMELQFIYIVARKYYKYRPKKLKPQKESILIAEQSLISSKKGV